MTAFDPQLRQRACQRSIYGCHLLRRELLVEASRGTPPRFLNSCFVDFVRRDSHVGRDGYVVSGDFYQSFAYGKEIVMPGLANDHLAWH
jgi:hypothetical protein